jgi:hypothetical protein
MVRLTMCSYKILEMDLVSDKQLLLRVHHRSNVSLSHCVHAFKRAVKWLRVTSAELAAGAWIHTRSLTLPGRCWTPAWPQSCVHLSLWHDWCARRRVWQKLQSTDCSLQTNGLPREFIILNTARSTMNRPTRTNTPVRVGEKLKMIESAESSPAMTKGKMVDERILQLPINS